MLNEWSKINIFADENEDVILKKAAQILSHEIDSAEGINIKPLDPSDISIDAAKWIVLLKLQQVLRDLWKFEDCNMKLLSIAQDIINISWKRRKKMPKCTGHTVSLKSSVGSKEFKTYLNKLGHILSCDDVLQIKTTWANGLLEAELVYTMIPSNITPGSHLSKLRLILLIMVKKMHHNM